MKNSNDTIGNRTHDLPVAIAVPQQTAPPRATTTTIIIIIIIAVTTPIRPITETAQGHQKKHTNNKQQIKTLRKEVIKITRRKLH
jgi:hypothetical protein